MSDSKRQGESAAGPRVVQDGSIQRKLFRSHLALGLLGLVVLSLALAVILRLAAATDQLAAIDGPTVRFSTLALVGIERSKSALRGWIVLGEERFREERQSDWDETILPAVADLDRISTRWQDQENRQRLQQIKRLLGDLRESQWWVEDVAQVAGNFPARVLYERDIGPIIERLQAAVTWLVEQLKAAPIDRRVTPSLGRAADLRYHLTRGDTALTAFVSNGQEADQRRLASSLAAARQALGNLTAASAELDPTERELLAAISVLLGAYEMLADDVVQRRSLPDANRAAYLLSTRVVPLSESVSQLLAQLSSSQTMRMNADARQAANLTRLATIILLALLLATAASTYWLSLRSARALTTPIQALVTATQEMTAGKRGRDIPIRSSDEIGQLTGSFNQMRASLEAATRQMQFAYQRLTSLVESAVDGIITIDERGTMESVNEAAVQIFGFARDEMIGENVKMLMPPPDREMHDTYLANYLRTGQATIIGRGRDVIAVRKDGTRFPVHLSISESRTEGERFFTGILYDLTERKQMEEALEASRQQLEQRAEELERSNSDLQQFAYVASHDLQEPLRAVAGFTQLLQQDYASQLDSKANDYIRHAVEGATRMQTLIRNLLEYSRVQTRGHPFEAVDCSEQLARALDALAVRIEDSEAEIEIDPLPVVRGDATQIQQLFQNLIGNALKFHAATPPRVQITVKELEDKWQFDIADNGIGIDDGHLERIFVIFQRLHSRTKYEGTGIGLAICQRIVQRHGGSIWAESAPGEGSTFCFTIPKDNSQQVHDERG